MALLYSIADLRPRPLKEAAVGTFVSLLDVDDTLYVRIDATHSAGGGTFLALDGKFTVFQVGAMNMEKLGQCLPPGELRVSIDAIGGPSSNITPGQLVLTEDGPVIVVKRPNGYQLDQYVSMSTWQFVDFPSKSWMITGAKLVWRPADATEDPTVLLAF